MDDVVIPWGMGQSSGRMALDHSILINLFIKTYEKILGLSRCP